jgi:DNA-binding CsgD family transcriptional regulator
MVAGALIEPKAFVKFIQEVLNPLAFPAVHFGFEDLGANCVRLVARVRPGARPNGAYFRVSAGGIRGMTRHLALPPIVVTRADISDEHGVWEATLPTSRTLKSRMTRASRSLVAQMTARLIGLEDFVPATDPFTERVDELTVEWDLTRRQIEVLKFVARGRANKEIAQALECAENTVELLVTRLLTKARVSSRTQLVALFWGDDER